MPTIFQQRGRLFSGLIRRIVLFSAMVCGLGATLRADQIIYDDALENGWQNWSWATVNFANPSPAYNSSPDSVSVTAGAYQALYFHQTAFDPSGFTNLTFWIHGGTSGGQSLQVLATFNGNPVAAGVSLAAPVANAWTQINVPISSLVPAGQLIDGLWIQNPGGSVLPVFYVDAVTLQSGPPTPVVQIIYDDALENSWNDWSWSATRNFSYNATYVHSGTNAISVTITSGGGALSLEHSAFDSSTYTNLTFWINGGASGGQPLQIYAETSSGAQPAVSLPTLGANTWQQMNFSLAALGVANQPNFTRFSIQSRSSSSLPTFYVDDVALQSGPPLPVSVLIDAAANRRAINPYVYGVAFASSASLSDMNVQLNRDGGNGTTTYNWQINAWNHAADWYFESIADSPSTAGADGDSFIQQSKSAGAQAMLTIPIIGWVAKLGPSRATLGSYAVSKYGPQVSADNSWGNGVGTNSTTHTSWLITTNDPTDANQTADTNFQSGWVKHLTNSWGTAASGGLRYYLMDNEWSIWHQTHRDVHPVGATMDEVLGKFCDYSTMVKGIDTNALVAGPEEWGWPGYLNSGYDLQNSGGSDRTAHGGLDFSPWFLSQAKQRSQTAGRRLLDIFTLHFYPAQSNVGLTEDVSTTTALARNRSTRSLWDPNYVDESWINTTIQLIPRMRNWVATNYPGTLTGITEYNFGADNYMNGATAQADVLGIFGREGLDLAARWTCPGSGTPVYNAFKMYRNYDGSKSTFGDTSVLAKAPNPDVLDTFAAVRSSDGALTLMVINKNLTYATTINASLTNFNAAAAHRWQLAAANVITHLADVALRNRVLSDVVPAQSITLYVLPPVGSFSLIAGTNAAPGLAGVPGQLTLWLNGQAGLTYSLQSSTDLIHWSAFMTTTLSSNSYPFFISTTNAPMRFYRGLWSP
jgi:hypothetical protein